MNGISKYLQEKLDLSEYKSRLKSGKEIIIDSEDDMREHIKGILSDIKNGKYKDKLIDLSNIEFSPNVSSLLYFLTNLSTIKMNDLTIDVTGWNLENIESINSIFFDCYNVNEVIGLDTWDTSNVENFGSAFDGSNIYDFSDIYSWNTSNAKYMHMMFKNCSSLEYMDLSSLDMSNVIDMSYMFYNCESLREVDMRGLDIGSCDKMMNTFGGCRKLERIVGLKDVKFIKKMDDAELRKRLNIKPKVFID